MIYVLVCSYDNYTEGVEPQLIFASTSKEVCENKHYELTKNGEFYSRINGHFDKEIRKWYDANPSPKEQNYADLPVKPLVWENEKWQNSYALEYKKIYDEYYKSCLEYRDQVIEKLCEIYKISKEDFDNRVIGYDRNISFSIEEVESD